MSIKLTDTQLVLLGAAVQRKDLCLVAPPTLKGATAQKVASKLISADFVKEVKAKASDPIWRRNEELGASYALKLTAAGAKAIAVDDAVEPGELHLPRLGVIQRSRADTPQVRVHRRARADWTVSENFVGPEMQVPSWPGTGRGCRAGVQEGLAKASKARSERQKS